MRATLITLLALAACNTPPGQSSVDIPPTDDPITDPGTDPVVQPPVVEDPVEAALPNSGPGEMIFNSTLEYMYVADVDNGAVHIWLRQPGRRIGTIELGAEPTRLTRRGSDVWVTLRGDGEVVHLQEDDDTLVEVSRAWVGAEPFDVLASEYNEALYVSLSQENAVVQLHPATLQELQRFEVDGEPRWMAAPTAESGFGDVLHVSSAMKPLITTISPQENISVTRALPEIPRFTHPSCDTRMLHRRITGSVSLTPSGETLYVPAMYADPLMPAPPVEGTTAPPMDVGCPQSTGLTTVAYYGFETQVFAPAAVSRFEPALVRMSMDSDTVEPELIHLASASVGPAGGAITHRGVPRSVILGDVVDDVPQQAIVTMESSNNLLVVDLLSPSGETVAPGFTIYERAVHLTGKGPIAALRAPMELGELWIYNWLSRDVLRLDEWRYLLSAPTGVLTEDPTNSTSSLPDSDLGEEIKKGRKLFYSSDVVNMVDRSFGTSCSNCHMDGRTDGFTWQFPDMWRQTPSLAGKVSDTLPLTWRNQVPTIRDEIIITTTTRMGGMGPSDEQLASVEAYIDWLRAPHRPSQDPALVAMGEEVFNRPEVACASCHAGEAGTNGQSYDILGETNVDTPALRGIGATAPYFHDGSAATLEDVVERARDGSMGYTGGLTDEERAALVAYLKQR